MLELHPPTLEELWFKAQMMGDEATMAYNHAWGGTIPFPEERWAPWHAHWVARPDGQRFYRYLKANGAFVGEVAYHLDAAQQIYLADIIIFAPHRGKGYGREGLQLLCEAARANGVSALYDDIAIDNPAISLFLKGGFEEVSRNDASILVKKQLNS